MKENVQYFNYWFDFGERESKINALQKISNPKNDNDILFNLQIDFLRGDEKSYGILWQKFLLLCLKAVKKLLKNKGVFVDQDTLQYKADIACEYVMRRYRTYEREKGDVYIINKFVTAAKYGAEHAVNHEGENDFLLDKCDDIDSLKI